MRTFQIAFASIAATANAVAQLAIPSKCKVKQVVWSVNNSDETDGTAVLELSKASATEVGVNGAQQVISNITLGQSLTTSGLSQTHVNFAHPVDVDVDQGQILYLHATISTMTVSGHVVLWTDR